eukprot:360278-Rhodomonas_salina.1
MAGSDAYGWSPSDVDCFVGLSGVYQISDHFKHESQRGVSLRPTSLLQPIFPFLCDAMSQTSAPCAATRRPFRLSPLVRDPAGIPRCAVLAQQMVLPEHAMCSTVLADTMCGTVIGRRNVRDSASMAYAI